MTINREIPEAASNSQDFGDLMDRLNRAGSCPKKPKKAKEQEKKAEKNRNFCGFSVEFHGIHKSQLFFIPTWNSCSSEHSRKTHGAVGSFLSGRRTGQGHSQIYFFLFSPGSEFLEHLQQPEESHGHVGIPMELSQIPIELSWNPFESSQIPMELSQNLMELSWNPMEWSQIPLIIPNSHGIVPNSRSPEPQGWEKKESGNGSCSG